jgi:photosystem II PsbY protein
MPRGKPDDSRSDPLNSDGDKSRIGQATDAAQSLRSPHLVSLPSMDARLVLVAAPILLAAGWAVFHIGRAAVGQLQLMLKRARA